MITLKDIETILINNNDALKALLIHLDVLEEIVVHDKTNPTLAFSDLVGTFTIKDTVDCDLWINDWRNMFTEMLDPYGLSMGIGNRQNCIDRMTIFLDRVGTNIDVIFAATEAYLRDCIDKGRKSRLPEYFILPQGDGKLTNRDIRTGGLYEWYTRELSGDSGPKTTMLDA